MMITIDTATHTTLTSATIGHTARISSVIDTITITTITVTITTITIVTIRATTTTTSVINKIINDTRRGVSEL